MSMRSRFNSTGIIAITLCAACSSTVSGSQPADLVAGIVSRSQAIASGRIAYTFKSESFKGDRALPPLVFPEATTSFSESSWAERIQGSHVVRANHDGYFLEFVQTPQKNGPVRPGATLYPPRSLHSRGELNAPPLFAGSFWHREQLDYVQKHAYEFHLTESSVINGIPVSVLELAVPSESHREAFHALLPALKTGGTMRLCVAPQLGFVLPRIELLTTSKQVAQSYNAMDFVEVAPGIYFPSRIRTQTHLAGGSSRYRGEFTIRCELFNQPIPEEDFVVKLPVGTRIQDAREPSSVIAFELGESSSSSALPALSSESGSSGGFLDRWRNAVIVGSAVGCVASISFLLAARNQRNRA